MLLEKDSDLGGTLRDNTYPGCACDVPSYLYSFSFEPNPAWSRMFAPQQEIWHYLRHCVDTYGLAEHIRYDAEVTSATWDEQASTWTTLTACAAPDSGGRLLSTAPVPDVDPVGAGR